jgi:acyl carrier protein
MRHDHTANRRYNEEAADVRTRYTGELEDALGSQQEVIAMSETRQALTLDTIEDTIRAQVRQYIMDNFLFDGVTRQIADDASLIERGVVDATGVLELMLFVEDSYGLQVNEADLAPENFDTISAIAHYVARHLANT